MNHLPPPVSMTDLMFIEEISENLRKIRQRRKSLQFETENRTHHRKSFDLRRSLKEDKKEMEKKKEKVLVGGEKELWEAGSWREHIKDLNSSFSKLPPISRQKKSIEGCGESFFVDFS